jgi:hypothetical protein
MAFLTVGATELEITSITETTPVEMGDRYRAFDGTERTTVVARKREWRAVTRPLAPAEFSAYRAALEAVPPLPCAGDALGGPVECSATILSAPYGRDGVGFDRVIEFELRER